MSIAFVRRSILVLTAAGFMLGFSISVAAQSRTLDKIRTTKAITLGYRESSIPFSFLDDDQKPVGFSLDLCAAVVEKIKTVLNLPELKVALVPVNPATRIPLIQNGTIDVECGSTTITAERQKQVGFTIATFISQPTWLTLSSSMITQEKDLTGRTVVMTEGSLNYALGSKINKDDQLGLTILHPKDQAESLLMLTSGRAVAWFEDNILQAGLVANSQDPSQFRYLPNPSDNLFDYGLMLPPGDLEFKALVDGVLVSSMASGNFSRLYDKWFTQPIPPHGKNLMLPMSVPLKQFVNQKSNSPNG